MENLLIGAAGGLIAGVLLLAFEYGVRRFERSRDLAEERIIKFDNENRRITSSIFTYLGPGSSTELMRKELGPPNKKSKEVIGLFKEDFEKDKDFENDELEEINSYVYLFKNAAVKICSRDGETIESLTVLPYDKEIAFDNYFYSDGKEEKDLLNVKTITPEMVEYARAEEFVHCRDNFIAVQTSVGPPFFIYLTWFCDRPKTDGDVTENPKLMIGSVINGVCLSVEQRLATYIYLSDTL